MTNKKRNAKTTTGAAATAADVLSLWFVVAGERLGAQAPRAEPLAPVVARVLSTSGNTGRPPEDWRARVLVGDGWRELDLAETAEAEGIAAAEVVGQGAGDAAAEVWSARVSSGEGWRDLDLAKSADALGLQDGARIWLAPVSGGGDVVPPSSTSSDASSSTAAEAAHVHGPECMGDEGPRRVLACGFPVEVRVPAGDGGPDVVLRATSTEIADLCTGDPLCFNEPEAGGLCLEHAARASGSEWPTPRQVTLGELFHNAAGLGIRFAATLETLADRLAEQDESEAATMIRAGGKRAGAGAQFLALAAGGLAVNAPAERLGELAAMYRGTLAELAERAPVPAAPPVSPEELRPEVEARGWELDGWAPGDGVFLARRKIGASMVMVEGADPEALLASLEDFNARAAAVLRQAAAPTAEALASLRASVEAHGWKLEGWHDGAAIFEASRMVNGRPVFIQGRTRDELLLQLGRTTAAISVALDGTLPAPEFTDEGASELREALAAVGWELDGWDPGRLVWWASRGVGPARLNVSGRYRDELLARVGEAARAAGVGGGVQ